MGDAKKANEKLGWAPKITLEELVDEMIKYDYHPFKNAYYHIPQDAFYFEKRIFEINQMIKEKDKKYYLILNDNLIN